MRQIHRIPSTAWERPGDKAHFWKARVSTLGHTTDVCRTGHTQRDPDLLHMHTGEQWWDALYHAPLIILSSLIGAKSRAAAAHQGVQGNWNGSSINERLLQSLSTPMTTLLSLLHQGVTEVLWCLFPEPVVPHLLGGIFSIIKEVLAG